MGSLYNAFASQRSEQARKEALATSDTYLCRRFRVLVADLGPPPAARDPHDAGGAEKASNDREDKNVRHDIQRSLLYFRLSHLFHLRRSLPLYFRGPLVCCFPKGILSLWAQIL